MPTLAGPPYQDSIIETDETNPKRRDPFYVAKAWLLWLTDTVLKTLQQAPQILKTVALSAQSAAIGATAIPLGSLTAGTYRVSYYARITTPDGVASSLTVTLGFTETANSLSFVGSAMTGDTVTTVQTGTATIVIDAASAITYATAYSSNTPAKMKYRLQVVVERLA